MEAIRTAGPAPRRPFVYVGCMRPPAECRDMRTFALEMIAHTLSTTEHTVIRTVDDKGSPVLTLPAADGTRAVVVSGHYNWKHSTRINARDCNYIAVSLLP